MTQIKFGTDGWRAVMAEDFTFPNVRVVVQGIADYLSEADLAQRGIVIGHDNRFFSEQFAREAAGVMAGNGVPVFLINKAAPTPVTAFTIRIYRAAGALMFTASHNPPEYNGIKFIPEHAGPAMPEVTNKIEEKINRVLQTGTIKQTLLERQDGESLVQLVDPFHQYIEHLKTLINIETIRQAGLKVVVDPLFGAGIGYLDHLLQEAGCEVSTINSFRDPFFGGKLPDPSAQVLSTLRDKVLESGAHLGLALDGDADRFGVIDAGGEFFTPNQILSILLRYLVKTRNFKGGRVARTVATTHMLDRMAEKYGLELEETPVGFKYIGDSLWKRGSIIGGEESGGISIKGHIPEKDGILSAALVAEIVAAEGKTVAGIWEEIIAEFGEIAGERLDLHCSPADKSRILAELKDFLPGEIAGIPVTHRITIDGTKFILTDGSWILIRPSGTEPLFRIYAEANDIVQVRKMLHEVKHALRM